MDPTSMQTTRRARPPMSGTAKAAIALLVGAVVVGGVIGIAAATTKPSPPSLPKGPYNAVPLNSGAGTPLPAGTYLYSIDKATAQSLSGDSTVAALAADFQKNGVTVPMYWDETTLPGGWPADDSIAGEWRLVLVIPAGVVVTLSGQGTGHLYTTGGVAAPSGPPPGPVTRYVSEANAGNTVSAYQGDTLVITLPGAPMPGQAQYDWLYLVGFGPEWQFVSRSRQAVPGGMETVDVWNAVGMGGSSTGASSSQIALVLAPVDAQGNGVPGGQPIATYPLTVKQTWPRPAVGAGGIVDEPMTGYDGVQGDSTRTRAGMGEVRSDRAPGRVGPSYPNPPRPLPPGQSCMGGWQWDGYRCVPIDPDSFGT